MCGFDGAIAAGYKRSAPRRNDLVLQSAAQQTHVIIPQRFDYQRDSTDISILEIDLFLFYFGKLLLVPINDGDDQNNLQ